MQQPSNSDAISFRNGVPLDAPALTELVFRAKAFWGYPKEWMMAWREELTILPDYIEKNWLELAYTQNQLVGFYGLEFHDSIAYLQHLWIEPVHIGRGFGRRF